MASLKQWRVRIWIDEQEINARLRMNVIIVGAGIGGLTAALELHRVGINARVFESVEEIRPLGVGINLLPHATHVLGECGLVDALAANAIKPKELIFFNKFGQ